MNKLKTKFKQTEIGMIPEEWEVKELKEIASYITEKINLDEISINNFISTESMLPDKRGITIASSLPKVGKVTQFKEGDILFSNIRTYFKKFWLAKFSGGCSNDVLVIRKKSSINNKYLYYYLSQDNFFEFTVLTSKGTKMPRGDKNSIMSYEINIPSFPEQSAIAKILSDLDQKIELSQQMNKTLEAIGQAIFKRWFVDFEFPNDKGKPYKSSGGEMVDSEFGEIPKGWKLKRIKDCGLVVCGKTPPTKEKENYGEDIFFITIPDMHNKFFVINTERKLSKKGADTQKKKELTPLTVCVSCIATPGLVILTSEKSQTNQQINSVICNNDISPYFMYLTMKEKAEEIKTRGLGGTATLNLNTGDFENIKIILPNKEILTSFHMLVDETFQKILTNEYQIQNLSQIRDSLLPRLMFGKIRVPVEVKA